MYSNNNFLYHPGSETCGWPVAELFDFPSKLYPLYWCLYLSTVQHVYRCARHLVLPRSCFLVLVSLLVACQKLGLWWVPPGKNCCILEL